VSRTPLERLADISNAAAQVGKAVEALEQAEAVGNDDEAQLAFDALLYRLVACEAQSHSSSRSSNNQGRRTAAREPVRGAIDGQTSADRWVASLTDDPVSHTL
jgi:hypothetical protein